MNEPGRPVFVKMTVPYGVRVPEPDVSVTVAVHVEACPARTVLVHVRVVEELRLFTVRVVKPELTA